MNTNNEQNTEKNFFTLPLSKAAKRKRRRRRKAALEATQRTSTSDNQAGMRTKITHSPSRVNHRVKTSKSSINGPNARVGDVQSYSGGNKSNKFNEIVSPPRLVGRLARNESSNIGIRPSRSGEFTVNSGRDDRRIPSFSKNRHDRDNSSRSKLNSGNYYRPEHSRNTLPSSPGEFSLRPTRSGVYSLKRPRSNEYMNDNRRNHFSRPHSPEYRNKESPKPLDDNNDYEDDYFGKEYFSPNLQSYIKSRSKIPNGSKYWKMRNDHGIRQMNPNILPLNNDLVPWMSHSQDDSQHSKDESESDVTSTNKNPSERYMRTALVPSIEAEKPLPKLIVFDLNGTLIFRTCSDIEKAILRPYIKEFMDYIFSGGFSVMVWSSAQPNNVKKMVKAAFGPHEVKLIDVWNRDQFSLTFRQYHRKTLTIKDLDKVWKKLNSNRVPKPYLNAKSTSFPASIVWDQTNTILIDDSKLKAQLQPFNSIHLLEFNESLALSGRDCELRDVIPYLETLKCQTNVSAYIKNSPYKSKELCDLPTQRNTSKSSLGPIIDLRGQLKSSSRDSVSFASHTEKNYWRFTQNSGADRDNPNVSVKKEMDRHDISNKTNLTEASYNSFSPNAYVKQEPSRHNGRVTTKVTNEVSTIKSKIEISSNELYDQNQQNTNSDNCKVS
ncbi:17005_t:CDS:1 [Acaulospora morrowiae]|uniref:17005_t:CDS:1 n=1 Tax=Acaulospora morrowiae TaxID=94023 RepID=A0A9N9ADX8_9GLOM|nr:17005_t:CDS:1 [Acaulospora morrowiae]